MSDGLDFHVGTPPTIGVLRLRCRCGVPFWGVGDTRWHAQRSQCV